MWTFLGKVMSLLFNTMSRFVLAFLARSIFQFHGCSHCSQWFLKSKKIRYVPVSIVSPSICQEMMGPDAMIFVVWTLSFKPGFSLSSLTFKKLFSSFLLSVIKVVSSAYLMLLIFLLAILIPAYSSSSLPFHMMCSVYKLKKTGWLYTALMCSFPNFEPVHCSTSSSNCCLLTCIQISQEAGKVVWYSHLFQNFAQIFVMHTKALM